MTYDCMARSEIPNIPLNRDLFLRKLIRELVGTLEETVGLDDAEGFISIVGNSIGRQLNQEYRDALNAPTLNMEQVASVLVDLKRRINGRFEATEITPERLVLSNTACPFAAQVEGRPSMCMMTSNVFGRIAAENFGYARVVLEETIASGDGRCVVAVHFAPDEGIDGAGREYFSSR